MANAEYREGGCIQVPMTKKKTATEKKGFCVYIGPSVKGYVQHCTIFAGGKTEALAALSRFIEKYPAARDLIVDHEAFPKARLLVKEDGNAVNEAYKRLVRQLSKCGYETIIF